MQAPEYEAAAISTVYHIEDYDILIMTMKKKLQGRVSMTYQNGIMEFRIPLVLLEMFANGVFGYNSTSHALLIRTAIICQALVIRFSLLHFPQLQVVELLLKIGILGSCLFLLKFCVCSRPTSLVVLHL
jgi:hypothetical protein